MEDLLAVAADTILMKRQVQPSMTYGRLKKVAWIKSFGRYSFSNFISHSVACCFFEKKARP